MNTSQNQEYSDQEYLEDNFISLEKLNTIYFKFLIKIYIIKRYISDGGNK